MVNKTTTIKIGGYLIFAYFTCKREAWFVLHNIMPEQEDENIAIGRLLHQTSYRWSKKEILLNNIKIDVVNKETILEVKKSSRNPYAAKWQLKWYLYELNRKTGTKFKGILAYPAERRREEVRLTQEDIETLEKARTELENMLSSTIPPVRPSRFCSRCAYRSLCIDTEI